MSRSPLLAVAVLAGCQTYSPSPVDLTEHARAFRARLTAEESPSSDFDLADGLTRREARLLALVFNPDCRAARRHAAVSAAASRFAGRWDDPALTADFERILESVQHPWLVGAAVELTLPLSGRRGLERELADAERGHAVLQARLAEHETLVAVDRAWANWSAAELELEASREVLARAGALSAVAARLAAADEITAPEGRVFALERLARADELAAAETTLAVARLQLVRVLGLHPEAEVEFTPAIDGALRAPGRDVEDHLQGGPRVAPAAREHAVSERVLALEIAKQWPDLVLGPGWAEEDAEPRLTLGFSLPLPLWNRNMRAIAEAEATRELRADALRSSLERALQALAIARTRHRAATERRARLVDQLLPLAERQLVDARTLAERGDLDPLLLLDSLTRLHTARLEVIRATLAEAHARSDIEALFWQVPGDPQ